MLRRVLHQPPETPHQAWTRSENGYKKLYIKVKIHDFFDMNYNVRLAVISTIISKSYELFTTLSMSSVNMLLTFLPKVSDVSPTQKDPTSIPILYADVVIDVKYFLSHVRSNWKKNHVNSCFRCWNKLLQLFWKINYFSPLIIIIFASYLFYYMVL